MRPDMSRVVVTRPRYGLRKNLAERKERKDFRGRSKHLQYLDEEELEDVGEARTSPMLPNESVYYCRKELSDFLSPLQRYLEGQVGRPWDIVYSEIRERISPKKTLDIHILQHVWGFVEKNIQYIDKYPYRVGFDGLRPLYKNELYITNRGLLARWTKTYPNKKKDALSRVLLAKKAPGDKDETAYKYYFFNGRQHAWYCIQFSREGDNKNISVLPDYMLFYREFPDRIYAGPSIFPPSFSWQGYNKPQINMNIAACYQLSKAEIKRLELS